jgi:hypothetical protein
MSDSEKMGEAIRLHVAKAAQLFNSLDPSPFHEKQIDVDAEKFIVDWQHDLGSKPFHIVVRLPKEALANVESAHIGAAMRNHFEEKAQSEGRRLRLELERGQWSLAIGISFLAACLALRGLLSEFTFPGSTMLSEGLLIIGWVAMWGPIEIFLYGWWPIAGRARQYERLARAPVLVEAAP